MGCRSDYMEPTGKERKLQETAILLGYALEETGQPVPRSVHAASKDIYCKTDLVPDLCNAIRNMDSETLKRVVYNPYNKESRQLADWWEEHEAADRARQTKDALAASREWAIRRLWEEGTQTLWPQPGNYASVSEENIIKFANLLLDKGRAIK